MKRSRNKNNSLGTVIILLVLLVNETQATEGHWMITQLPYQFAEHPVINNTGEIVWAQQGGGIFSSVRGQLAASGFNPHLANSGAVVYADWVGGPNWDLISTTRGQLTHDGIININTSDFDVNTNGEVVYVNNDTNGYSQIYSTVTGQITFDATDHSNPCINDNGEVIWNQVELGTGYLTISASRGVLPGINQTLRDLNNAGDYCYSGYVDVAGQPGYHTFPHVFSSLHGVIIDDSTQYQWEGGINDGGTIVWQAQDGLYEANWMIGPTITIVTDFTGYALEWATNTEGYHVQYSTNLISTSSWQAMVGNLTTNSVCFHLPIQQNLGNSVFFRLSNVSP